MNQVGYYCLQHFGSTITSLLDREAMNIRKKLNSFLLGGWAFAIDTFESKGENSPRSNFYVDKMISNDVE